MRNWFKKLCQRARYQSQFQGDEQRGIPGVLEERYTENELVEGEHVAKLASFFKMQDWDGFNRYVEQLRIDGHSESRVNSMVASATRGKI